MTKGTLAQLDLTRPMLVLLTLDLYQSMKTLYSQNYSNEYHGDQHPDPDHDHQIHHLDHHHIHLDQYEQGTRTLMGTPLQRENAQLVPFTTPMPRPQLSSEYYDDHYDDKCDHYKVHCALHNSYAKPSTVM